MSEPAAPVEESEGDGDGDVREQRGQGADGQGEGTGGDAALGEINHQRLNANVISSSTDTR